MDETASTINQFEQKYGWSPIGEKAIRTQIEIQGKHYSVIAAYGLRGFICWSIFEGPVAAIQFVVFLDKLASCLDDNCLLLDNCSIHKTAFVRQRLEIITNGDYEFSPKYSPDLKPIERAFSNVKRYVRNHRNINTAPDPLAVINEAFSLYSSSGELGNRGKVTYDDANN